jgi:anti-sigma B factor antagonist
MDWVEPVNLELVDAVAGDWWGGLRPDLHRRIRELSRSGSERLAISIWRPTRNLFVAAVAGEMDAANAAELERRLVGARAIGPFGLIIDLSELTFIDSTGIKALAWIASQVQERGETMLLASPTAEVARILEIVRLNESIVIAGSLEAALRCCGSSVRVPRHARGL